MESNNSIRNNISREEIISTILLELSADISHELTFLVVEGIDDLKFFEGKVSENTHLFESFSGKEGLREIVEYFGDESIIGISDRDYDYSYSFPRVFCYDYSNLEMMLISADEVFNGLANEYYKRSEQVGALKKDLLQELAFLSCLRRLNYNRDLGVKFAGMSVNKCVDTGSKIFSVAKLFENLQKIDSCFMEKYRHIFAEVSAECRTDFTIEQLLEMTQGHDFIAYFQALHSLGMKRSKLQSVQAMESSLRCAYRLSDFAKTELYADVQRYGEVRGVCVFKVA